MQCELCKCIRVAKLAACLLRRQFPRIDEGDDIAHNLVQLEVFGRIDRCDSHFAQAYGVIFWDDTACNDGDVA